MELRGDTTHYGSDHPRHSTIVSGETVDSHYEDDEDGDGHSMDGGSGASQCSTDYSLKMGDEGSEEENDGSV
jgi:hypothetical protein